jgi:hypothetical protein
MSQHDELRDCLRVLAEGVPQEAGPWVQEQLLVRFRERRQIKKRRAYLAGIAASIAIAVGVWLTPWHSRSVPTTKYDPASGFITLPYAQSEVPLEQPVIVRVNIPVSELGVMGLAPASKSANESVSADLLVGQDGIARAVRFVE